MQGIGSTAWVQGSIGRVVRCACLTLAAPTAAPAAQMPSTLIFDYPSARAVTEYLTAQMLKSAAAAAAAAGPALASAGDGADLDGSDLALSDGVPSALASAAWAQQQHLAVLAVVAHPLMAEPKASVQVGPGSPVVVSKPLMGPLLSCRLVSSASLRGRPHLQAVAASTTADSILRVPLQRWDLDTAEALLGDPLTLSAQVGAPGPWSKGALRAAWSQPAGAAVVKAAALLTPLHSLAAVQFGAFMCGVDEFDAAAHGLSAAEATATDPQHRWVAVQFTGALGPVGVPVCQASTDRCPSLPPLYALRLVLTAAAEALAAGSTLQALAPAHAGVFVGISWTEYARLAADAGTGR